MGFPTKVQLIKRQASEQWYINFPSALAQAMDLSVAKRWSGPSRTSLCWLSAASILPAPR